MRRAEFARGGELRRLDVDGDDRNAAGEPRALDRIQPDAAAADHDNARAGFDVRGVDDRADAGHHAAGDQRGDVERDVPGDGRRPGRRRRRTCSAKAPVRIRGRAACRRSRGAGLPVEREHLFAEHRRAVGAGGAEAAVADQGGDDRVARLEPSDSGSDRRDDARCLVAVDRGQVAAPGAIDIQNVAVADPAGRRLDQDFAGPRRGDLDRFDRQRRPEGPADCGSGFHGTFHNSAATPAGRFPAPRLVSSAALMPGHAFLRGRAVSALPAGVRSASARTADSSWRGR